MRWTEEELEELAEDLLNIVAELEGLGKEEAATLKGNFKERLRKLNRDEH